MTTLHSIAALALILAAPASAQDGETFTFYNVYSRPNDDTFQNIAGNSGEPYEVARVRAALVITRKGRTHRLRLEWQAEMTTGRHVESGHSFVLEQRLSSLSDERKTSKIDVRYPPGADAESVAEKKKGSLLVSSLDLGVIEGDGSHNGLVRIRTALGADTGGVNQLVDRNLSNGGIFQHLRWRVTINGGLIASKDIEAERFKEPQVKLIESNIKRVDPSLPQNRPYPPQPPAAAWQPEVVGDDPVEAARVAKKFEALQKLGVGIRRAGCLDCHGQGNKDLERFYDNGIPQRPAEDVLKILSLVERDENVDWKRYPGGMRKGVLRLRADSEIKPLLEELEKFLRETKAAEKPRPGR